MLYIFNPLNPFAWTRSPFLSPFALNSFYYACLFAQIKIAFAQWNHEPFLSSQFPHWFSSLWAVFALVSSQ